MKSILTYTESGITEHFKTFTKLCKEKNLPYHYLKRLKYPINYKGILIDKFDIK
jgi:hypothetical protein